MKNDKKKATTYEVVEGDVFEKFFSSTGNAVFAHGANCFGAMASGVAAQVRDKITPLYYKDLFETRTPPERLGNLSSLVLHQDEKSIKIGVNLYTQFRPGPEFDDIAFVNSLRSLKLLLKTHKELEDTTLYIPKIGCGIGGAKWEDVEPLIKRELSMYNVVVVVPPAKEETKGEEKATPKPEMKITKKKKSK